MAATRHPQFCALARASEVVGERWTLLIVRELVLGPRRFVDLRARLDGVSTSVLARRLAALEAAGVVARRTLSPPAGGTVYELTASGRALEPAVAALIRWSARFLAPGRPRDRFEPDWLRLALAACARRGATPPVSIRLRLRDVKRESTLRVAGGPAGTTVTADEGGADATIGVDPRAALALATGLLDVRQALRDGRARLEEGDTATLAALPALFQAPDYGESSSPSSMR